MSITELKPRVHHVGVQTSDLENSVRWYTEFFGARRNWELDRFSELTLRRLPGIGRLAEVATDTLRVHLFDRTDHSHELPRPLAYQFQHVCLEVDRPEDLQTARNRWIDLYESGRFTFARPDQPTDIVVDSDGVSSFYLFDPNGLEYEFTHVPEGPR
ncbi:MAG TPA: VOC family protein [Actinoplanes sp.]